MILLDDLKDLSLSLLSLYRLLSDAWMIRAKQNIKNKIFIFNFYK